MRRTVIAAVTVAVLIAGALAFVLTGQGDHGHPVAAPSGGAPVAMHVDTGNHTLNGTHDDATPTAASSSTSVEVTRDLYSQVSAELLDVQRKQGSAAALEELELRSRADTALVVSAMRSPMIWGIRRWSSQAASQVRRSLCATMFAAVASPTA